MTSIQQILGTCGHRYMALINVNDWPNQERIPGVGVIAHDTVPCEFCRGLIAEKKVDGMLADANTRLVAAVAARDSIVAKFDSAKPEMLPARTPNRKQAVIAWSTEKSKALDGPSRVVADINNEIDWLKRLGAKNAN